MFMMTKWEVLALALLFFCHCFEAEHILNVSSNCSQRNENSNDTDSSGSGEFYCLDLDSALNDLRNGTSLILEPGTHIIRQPQCCFANSTERDTLSNITITGAGVNRTVITCEDGHGLVFIGVKNLKLAGFTILNCGLASGQLDLTFSLLSQSIDFFFLTIPPTSHTKIAMLIGNCFNVVMKDIHITNTTGLGLLGVNVVGSSMLSSVNFTRNVRPLCLKEALPDFESQYYYDQIGGGAYFVFFDYLQESSFTDFAFLHVRDSYFAYNADCTKSAFTFFNIGFDLTRFFSYTLGAGGGFSAIAASRDIEVRVEIADTIFYQNDARYGAGAFVATFAEVQRTILVMFENCVFLENGVRTSDDFTETRCQGGGGLAIFTGLTKPQSSIQETNTSTEASVHIVVSASNFTQNRAEIQGGGVMAYSLFNTFLLKQIFSVKWEFVNLTFEGNSAGFSSALHAAEIAFSGLAVIVLHNLKVQNNFNQIDVQNVDTANSAVSIEDVTCIMKGVVIFYNNLGSALRIVNAEVVVEEFSSVLFERNIAHRGGAIYFSGESALIKLDTGSKLSFFYNQAVAEGGAMYVAPLPARREIFEPESSGTFSHCFIKPLSSNFSLNFSGNFAPLPGAIFYGPSQEKCTWAADYLTKDFISKDLSTLPTHIEASLSNTSRGQYVFPGQMVDIDIAVFDAYNHTIPALVSSLSGSSDTTAILGSSGFWHTSSSGSHLTVLAANYTGPLTIPIVVEQNLLSTTFTVNLASCPLGFSSDVLTPRCICHEALMTASNILCLEESVSFVTRENSWIGVEDINQSTTDDLVIHRCPLDFCKAFGNNNSVHPPDFDTQCDFNRSGFLCGSCAQGYSLVFGTNECRKCNNYWLFLIPTFAIAGAILFSGIALLEITIDKGLTNVMIFYGSVVSLFDFLSPSDINFSHSFIYIRFLVLQLGVPTCFYDGMTSLQRSALQFVFPLYLFVLMGIFTLLCRRFTWMSIHFSPAKTLETLTVMCYLSVLNTSVDVLIFIRVDPISRGTSYRWFFDPSVKYFSWAHGALAAFSLLIVIFYIIPVPLVFLFPSLAYKYLKKLTPCWDILWAAYKPKFRFWLGIRVFLIIAAFSNTRIPLDYAYIISSTLGLVSIVCEALIQPYKDKWANYAYVTLQASLYLYLRRIQTLSNRKPGSDSNIALFSNIFLVTLCLIITVVYFLLFVLHIYRQFPSLGSRIRQLASRKKQGKVKKLESEPVPEHGSNETHPLPTRGSLQLDTYQPPPFPFRVPRQSPKPVFRDSILETLDEDD